MMEVLLEQKPVIKNGKDTIAVTHSQSCNTLWVSSTSGIEKQSQSSNKTV